MTFQDQHCNWPITLLWCLMVYHSFFGFTFRFKLTYYVPFVLSFVCVLVSLVRLRPQINLVRFRERCSWSMQTFTTLTKCSNSFFSYVSIFLSFSLSWVSKLWHQWQNVIVHYSFCLLFRIILYFKTVVFLQTLLEKPLPPNDKVERFVLLYRLECKYQVCIDLVNTSSWVNSW